MKMPTLEDKNLLSRLIKKCNVCEHEAQCVTVTCLCRQYVQGHSHMKSGDLDTDDYKIS